LELFVRKPRYRAQVASRIKTIQYRRREIVIIVINKQSRLYDLAQATRLMNEHLRPLAHSHSFAITVYTVQGISLDSIVLANLYESTKGNQPHLAYVALSRARSKDGLFLLRTIATVLLVDKHVYQ
jgi:hypothetical protein